MPGDRHASTGIGGTGLSLVMEFTS